ncbi:hypothetical protein LPB19_03590 [Marinobacter salinisoli]|uniref:Uncharacterized protein n=1 Tax=Marinobacter salinisoli TaxID=2769486 RepID=A0ABX7MTL7_9GAMM|nr:hypothetical protein [Marinobacter salinisoli]QSP95513.1 hypothetical protein LPB19_03590 [Marinobacter salinisoli]
MGIADFLIYAALAIFILAYVLFKLGGGEKKPTKKKPYFSAEGDEERKQVMNVQIRWGIYTAIALTIFFVLKEQAVF